MVTPEHARRTFQIVVAATRQWGIGKGMIHASSLPSMKHSSLQLYMLFLLRLTAYFT
jgi:hypothetical protein